MQDTSPEFRRRVSEAFARLPPSERVRMCTDMFDTARALVEASLGQTLSAKARRRELCRRFYGDLADRVDW